MAGLCESGNEPPGSLKACKCSSSDQHTVSFLGHKGSFQQQSGTVRNHRDHAQYRKSVPTQSEPVLSRKHLGEERMMLKLIRKRKELVGSLAEKKLPLPTEGCTGRNGEREKSSGQK
ncbi:hypothetical protein ANN_25415 [Periplaneta americana]|uniref:Uncharacterized protein n=1 Tax=Periplaneta americana TaxID=6978 RepID=A0ABQ8S1E5_PERAM|nr:hypothetical protein ANN_25415 [Periplaneta americana]